MTKRFFTLLVALAITSAPVALEICQISCESNGLERSSISHVVDVHAGHHGHPMPAGHEHRGTQKQLSPASSLCDHDAQASPSLAAARNFNTFASILATAPATDTVERVRTGDLVLVSSSPSDRLGIPLATPLRV